MQSEVRRQRLFWFRVAVLMLAALVVLLSWLGSADRASVDYIDGALLQASVAFASARALNALISVLQSTTLSFSLFGGVAVTLGELLDPFNDLIEQYGTLMQWAIGSLLTQKILLGVVSHGVFKVLISVSAALLALGLWWRDGRFAAEFLRLFLALVFLRFAMAAVVLLNGTVDHYFLDDQTRQQVAQLDNLPAQVELLGSSDGVLETEPALNALGERQRTLQQQRGQLQAEGERVSRALSQSSRALSEAEQQMGSLERINPFARSEDHAALIRQVERLNEQQQTITQQQRQLTQQLAEVGRERAAVQQAKSSDADASVPLGEQFARAADPQTYLAIKQALDRAVDTVLRAMTLFVLRTLILPLLFLYFLIKGLRAIWRLELQLWLRATPRTRRPLAD
tara:strand:- start:131 stop:1324 length:1194 start_codon:yes stop_codon:yes gene_type:complete